MSNSTVPSNPFNKIALCLSGGGYRAASFHLGSMCYLNRVKYNNVRLLDQVKMISTVSGGTITGIIYALKKSEGDSFEDIYKFIMTQLAGIDLLQEGIAMLNPGVELENPNKRKNLINAFSELYKKYFTGGATLGTLQMNGLETVVFNSTDFSNALDFRFRDTQAAYSGNYFNKVGSSAAKETLLADVMAASSCFPGGFEPIMWPDDFVHDQAPTLLALKGSAGQPKIGLMDGGIYDNQGIDAVLNYKKNADPPYFDLVVVSDVASPYMQPFVAFVEKPKKSWLMKWTVGQIKFRSSAVLNWTYVILGLLVAILALLPLFTHYANNMLTGLSIGLSAGFLLLLGLVITGHRLFRKFYSNIVSRIHNIIPAFYREKLSVLKLGELSVHRAEPLLMDRLNSLASLLLNVFLKVVRRLNYKILYTNDNYKYRRISTLIKGLTKDDFDNAMSRKKADKPDPGLVSNSMLMGDYVQVVGSLIPKIADDAGKFGTTLWFTPKDQLDNTLQKLVITGQFTMCYNLLEYLEKVIFEKDSGFSSLPAGTQSLINETYLSCKSDWEGFIKNPEFMMNEMNIGQAV